MPQTITSEFTATPHAAIAQLHVPHDQAGRLPDQAAGTARTSDVGHPRADRRQRRGRRLARPAATSAASLSSKVGPQQYTVYFDITFSQPFTSSKIITEPGQTNPQRGVPHLQHHVQPGRSRPRSASPTSSAAERQAELADRDPGLGLRPPSRPRPRPAGTSCSARSRSPAAATRRPRSSTACCTRTSCSRTSSATSTASTWAPTGRCTRSPPGSRTSTACSPAGTSTTRWPSCRPCSTRRPPATWRSRWSTTTPERHPAAVGLPEPGQLRHGRRPVGRDHRGLLRVRRQELRHHARR